MDYPVALTLDDTGQRIFVLGDQSHTVATFDTGDGSLVAHTKMYGDPIAVLRRPDRVDPTLRAGLTLFYRANSSKGPLPTTAKNWMSCGGCHLDGFTSTNARLFEALSPPNPAEDALIGHVGLVDDFTTAAKDAPDPSPFNPHHLLVAPTDQGGLAPNPPGRDCNLAVTMAQQLATVVARDLPDEGSWEQPRGQPYPSWGAAFCGGCHSAEYEAWRVSVHSRAVNDGMVTRCLNQEPPFTRQCAGCHDPMVARVPQTETHGVTCLGCHDVEREMGAGGNGDLVAVAHADWGGDRKARALASLETLRRPEFCGGCHQQFVPGNGFAGISTYAEYRASSYPAAGTRCIDCHMQKIPPAWPTTASRAATTISGASSTTRP